MYITMEQNKIIYLKKGVLNTSLYRPQLHSDTMAPPVIRMNLNIADCNRVSGIQWKDHGGNMSMCSYYHVGFQTKYAQIHPDKLRFFVTDFIPSKVDTYEHLHRVRLYGHDCVLTGTCTFIGTPGCHVRACTANHGDHYGVEFFFFAGPGGPILAHTFFYMHLGKADYEYNPLIVEIPAGCDHLLAMSEILSNKRRRAAWTIQCAWLRAKYSPKYDLCKKLLLRDMQTMHA